MQAIAIMSVGSEFEIETFEESDVKGFVEFSQNWFNTVSREEVFMEEALNGWTYYGTDHDVNWGVFKVVSDKEVDRIMNLDRADLENFVNELFNV
jgi:hypothetical protein